MLTLMKNNLPATKLENESLNVSKKWSHITAFPEISYQEFQELPDILKEEILAKNRIVNSDTYNRTMEHLSDLRFVKGKEAILDQDSKANKIGNTIANSEATYALQLRRSPYDFLIASGIESMVENLTFNPITQAELDFAIDHFKNTNVKFFNENIWKWVIEENNGILPFTIRGVKDGTVMIPGEDFLTITGPSELVAHFEQYAHRIFYESLVATKARMIVEILGDPKRFVEVGLRSAVNDKQHYAALHAMLIGGGLFLTSSDASPALFPTKDTGTIGHRYIQTFTGVKEAFEFGVENLDFVVLLLDLVDTYQGMDQAFELKQKYRETDKKIAMRLDSGNILEQTREFLRRSKELGFTDPIKDLLIVEGVDSLEEIIAIEKMIESEFGSKRKAQVIYGAGGLLVSEKTSRSDASSGLKIARFTNENGEVENTLKLSNSPGKESDPGQSRIIIVDGQRVVAQEGEILIGSVTELFETLYDNGIRAKKTTIAEGQARASKGFEEIKQALLNIEGKNFKSLRAVPSPKTKELAEKVREKYGLLV